MNRLNRQLFVHFNLRSLRATPLRTALTLVGIALGVAVLLAIHLANHTALAQFRTSLEQVTGHTALEIRSATGLYLPETVLTRLRGFWRVPGLRFTPVLEATASLPSGETLQVLGLEFFSDREFRTLRAETPGASADLDAAFQLFAPEQTLVSPDLARAQGWRVGQSVSVWANDRARQLRVAGLLPQGTLSQAYGGRLLVMDLANAQGLFSLWGQISRVDLKVSEDQVPQVQAALQSALGGSVTVERPERRTAQAAKLLRAFHANLTALSFVSLLVGMFLIYNTMSMAVIRRRPDIGTLRALGVSRRAVAQCFLFEALGLGLVGSVLGVGLGLLLAQGAVKAVSATVETLYLNQGLDQLLVDPGLILLAVALGTGLTVLAAVPPTLEAAGVSPAEATRRASLETRVRRWIPLLTGAGAVAAVAAAICAVQPPVGQLPVFGYAAALLIVLSASFWLPGLLLGTRRLWLPLLGRGFGAPGRLAVAGLYGSLGRTAVAVASLMVGIAMMVSLAVMIDSFRQTVVAWVNQSIRADLWIKPASRASGHAGGRLSPEVVRIVQSRPEVAALDPFLEFPITVDGEPTRLGTGYLEVLARYGSLRMKDPLDQAPVLASLRNQPGVLVTESFSLKFRRGVGDTVTLNTPSGLTTLPIRGVYYDYSSEQGYVVLPRWLFERLYRTDAATNLAVYLKPGADAAPVRDALERQLPRDVRLVITTNRELRAEVMRIFDQTFSITYALHLIAIGVALLGVLNTLLALVLESRRDLGILAYLGASRVQLRRLVLAQAGLLGVWGYAAGLGSGLVLASLLIEVINKQSFGWTITWHVPWPFLVQSFGLVMLSALLAGLLPARMAASTPAPAALRGE